MATARADWKDGCPAFFPPENAPDYTEVKTHGGSASFGALPELDTLLGPSRIAIEGWRSTLDPETSVAPIHSTLAGRGLLQVNFSSGPMFGALLNGYSVEPNADGNHSTHLGDVPLFFGYRHTSYLFGPMFRTGLAIRVADGGPLTERTSDNIARERAIVAGNTVMRVTGFGVTQPISAAAEYRIEMVGCRAPFADLRVDVSHWRTEAGEPPIWDVPIELALGAYPVQWIAMYAAIGEELRSGDVLYHQMTRVTFGIDFEGLAHDLRVGLRASGISGKDVGGYELGFQIAYLFAGGKTLE